MNGSWQRRFGRFFLPYLSPADLVAISVDSYRAGCGFDEHLFNSQGLHPWEMEVIGEKVGTGDRVLIAAAGAGREMIAMSRLGFRVTGFDPSPFLVDAGRRYLADSGIEATLDLVQPGQFPKQGALFNGVLVGSGAYHHIPSREFRIDFLKECAARLVPRGWLVIGSVSMDESGRGFSPDATFPGPGDSLVEAFGHDFIEEELVDEISAAGFSTIKCHVFPNRPAFLASALKA